MRQFHFFCKQRYLKYTVLSLLLCPLSSSAAEEWKDVKGESTTKIVESTQQKKQKRVITGVVRDGDTNEPIIGASVWLKNSSVGAVTDIDTRVRDNILKSKEQKNIQPTKGGHKMVTCQNYVSLFYRQITSCPSDGGIS